MPASWEKFRVRWKHGATTYDVAVENPERRNRGVALVELDGARVDTSSIPLVDDGAVHRVRVLMGEPVPVTSTTRPEGAISESSRRA